MPEESPVPSKGRCALCGTGIESTAAKEHVRACLAAAPGPKTARPEAWFHLLVEGRYDPEYWLHLGLRQSASLDSLDRFLRRTWLECCGHLSAFTFGRKRLSCAPDGELDEGSMDIRASRVLTPRMKFLHEYDFGTTTELALTVLGTYQAPRGAAPVALLAGNEAPARVCATCGAPATLICAC